MFPWEYRWSTDRKKPPREVSLWTDVSPAQSAARTDNSVDQVKSDATTTADQDRYAFARPWMLWSIKLGTVHGIHSAWKEICVSTWTTTCCCCYCRHPANIVHTGSDRSWRRAQPYSRSSLASSLVNIKSRRNRPVSSALIRRPSTAQAPVLIMGETAVTLPVRRLNYNQLKLYSNKAQSLYA